MKIHHCSLLTALVGAVASAAAAVAAPELPLSTQGRWIVDASGARVKLRCANWAGHMEANVPEGLHKQPVGRIADIIAAAGFNCVRLTYSVDHALAPNVKVADAFISSAGSAGVGREAIDGLLAQVAEKNPWVLEGEGATTRRVFEEVIKSLWDRGVVTILDNHVSKAGNIDDGNGWWDEAFGYNRMNSRYFHTQNWLDGLSAMASWGARQPGVVGLGLRNEVREWLLQGLNGRADWYKYMEQGARLVHAAHPDALILIGGTLSSTDLSHVKVRNLDWSEWRDKHVWEWHSYSFTVNFPNSGQNCDFTRDQYGWNNGFVLEQNRPWTAPLILSEFGFGMVGGPRDGLNDDDRAYFDCLKGYVLDNDSEWAIWGIMGSYYFRDGQVDYDEPYGVLNRDWEDFRNPKLLELLGKMFDMTQGPK
ncbi:hypothetical protein DL764_000646 [Monosporascus ibericus]|uniref:Glycoside hydrolase family 5 domain-containing protein n=1 Tax=Monosporascus ibericus TaxID=155417 RepID=A0A4Q4TXV4_9PEZI|nr:hypothetical protein DL764_000646 [Monosporascus ibericus]